MCEAGLKPVWMEKIIKLGKCGFKTMLGSHFWFHIWVHGQEIVKDEQKVERGWCWRERSHWLTEVFTESVLVTSDTQNFKACSFPCGLPA